MEEEIDYPQSISSISSAVLYDDYDEEDDIRGYQRRLMASVKVTSAAKAKISAIGLDNVPTPRTFTSKERHLTVTATELSDLWLIGLFQATATLNLTTQNIFRSAVFPLGRHYKADRLHHLPCLPGDWYTDTLHGRTKSKVGNRYGQVFANTTYFDPIYPTDTKKKVGEALRFFCPEFGFTERLTIDGAPDQVGRNSAFMKEVQKQRFYFQVIKPERHNQNTSEVIIR